MILARLSCGLPITNSTLAPRASILGATNFAKSSRHGPPKVATRSVTPSNGLACACTVVDQVADSAKVMPPTVRPNCFKKPLISNPFDIDPKTSWKRQPRQNPSCYRELPECTTESSPITFCTSNNATSENTITSEAEANTDGLKSVSMPKNNSTG